MDGRAPLDRGRLLARLRRRSVGLRRRRRGDDGDDGAVDPFCEEDTLPGPLTHFVRLTHGQYDNTVRDLLGVDTQPSDAFLGDTSVKGFTNNADNLTVTDRLARDHRRAAEQIATELLADPTRLASVVGCDPAPDPEACAQSFIATFGRRVFRRPLDGTESAAFFAIYQTGAGLYEGGTDFEQGIAPVVEAFLQSPSFVYRVELSSPPADAELVALTGWEVARTSGRTAPRSVRTTHGSLIRT